MTYVMKLTEAIEKGKNRNWLGAHIRKNPSSLHEWFVMLVDKEEIPHMLVGDDEIPIVSADLNTFTDLLKQFGIHEFTIFS